jgi:uncharacterized protein YfdQ (DUF2303 family)
MQMNPYHYHESDAASLALVAEQAQEIAELRAEPVFRDDAAGVAFLTGGGVINWSNYLDRPSRLSGTTRLATPAAFAEFTLRHRRDGETIIFADKAAGRLVAVFNAAPLREVTDTVAVAGHADHRAILDLTPDPDWVEWESNDRSDLPQDRFGELIDGLAHTMVRPDAATMMEIATSITGRQRIDYSSRTRLATGEVSFKFEQDTTMRAGKGATEIEIPESFVFAVSVWEGTPAVEVTARLRTKASHDGVRLGYRIIRKAQAVTAAFASVVEQVTAATAGTPVFLGSAP